MTNEIIANMLEMFANKVRANNTNATEDELVEICEKIGMITNPDERLSKYEVAKLLGVNHKTVDYYVSKGYIPEGTKWKQGVVEKFWYKKDIVKFKESKNNKNDK